LLCRPSQASSLQAYPIAMDVSKTARRKSLNAAEDAQPFRRALSPAAAAERNAKRHTWALDRVRAPDHAGSENNCEEQVSFAVPHPELFRSASTDFLQLVPPSRLREVNFDLAERPSSVGSSRSSVRKAVFQQAGALAPIMEKKYVEISTTMHNRNATPTVKRFDARTRTTSDWDGLRRVS
jgi:hypothetical protein